MIATVFFYQNYGAVIAVINTQFKNLFNMSRCRKQREREKPQKASRAILKQFVQQILILLRIKIAFEPDKIVWLIFISGIFKSRCKIPGKLPNPEIIYNLRKG